MTRHGLHLEPPPDRDPNDPTGGAVAWLVIGLWFASLVLAFLLGRWS